MATVTNRSKVLSVQIKVKSVARKRKLKKKADVGREFGLVNSAIQMTGEKKERNPLGYLNRTNRE
jgi:hypothetical protein